MRRASMIVAGAVIIATLALIAPACATETVALADLEATTRSLGFLGSLQNRPTISIGVVYGSNLRDDKALAAQTARTLSTMAGPGSSVIRASILTAAELADRGLHFDVLYIMPSATGAGPQITDAVQRMHAVSISNDPACLDAKYCVLMVQASSGVTIVIDTALAAAADAQFSSVFLMMVKRR
jgi:hypothetical protein